MIKLTFTYDKGAAANGQKTGETKEKITYINPAHIESVQEWRGELIHSGREGTKITLTSGAIHIDDRSTDKFMQAL